MLIITCKLLSITCGGWHFDLRFKALPSNVITANVQCVFGKTLRVDTF